MIIIKDIKNSFAPSFVKRERNLNNDAFDPNQTQKFKLLKPLFDQLLASIFIKFKTRHHRYYLQNRGLSIHFERFLVQKSNVVVYSALFNKLQTFYNKHPFAFEAILMSQMHHFFSTYQKRYNGGNDLK